MLRSHLEICLFQPEIPQNTGNIGRLCAATQCRLHLVTPLGFDSSDKQLRRAGLDYWPYLDLEIHDSFAAVAAAFKPEEIAFYSKASTASYSEVGADVKLLVFGRETSGLPIEIWEEYSERFFSIPIFHPKVRSLNLSNSVAIVLYHQLLLNS